MHGTGTSISVTAVNAGTIVVTVASWIGLTVSAQRDGSPNRSCSRSASARYLQGLDDGTIPLLMLFSGTIFVATEQGYSVELVPWSAEASYRMPVSIWRGLVDAHFPGSAWLRCSRQTLDELAGYKRRHALPTWDATLTALLARGDDPPRPPREGIAAADSGGEPDAEPDHEGETGATQR